MSMSNLNKELEKVLKKKTSESYIIKQLDELIVQYGVSQIELWRNLTNNKKNSLLHELVDKHYIDVIRYIIPKYNLKTSIQRDFDYLTPFELAHLNQDWKMCNILLEFNDNQISTDTYEKFVLKKQKTKMMNIVWIDLEFTSFDNPQILECAVIITDKDLNELERKEWVVHFEQNILDGLSEWHQNAFKDHHHGGNNLFSDVIHSKITREEMEKDLLNLLKRYCPEKACPLAGSSIHIDREVMKTEMPSVHRYLHYRIIDVSSFREMMKRWAPITASKFVKQIAENGKETVSHRAMDDIEWSIELMKMFKPLLTARQINKSNTENVKSISVKKFPTIIPGIEKLKLYSDERRLLERLKFEEDFDVINLKFNYVDQRLYDQNPHLREIFINKKNCFIYDKEFNQQNRLLDLSWNEKSNSKEINTTEHWEQRKLILSEIEFLTNYVKDENDLVIYVGAAPGIHLNYLSSLFPQVQFVLIDTNEFVATETEKMKIISEGFTENLAKKYFEEKKNILFICNIHTFTNDENLGKDIEKDISDLVIWQSIMNPSASLLTFRLPHLPGKTLFFEGHMLLDTWTSRQSTECRLILKKDAQMIEYDNLDFERAMNYFQNVIRTMYYEHDFDSIETEGLDHCYDCRSEIFILQKYLTKIQMLIDDTELNKKIAQLSYDISRNIYQKNRPRILDAMRTLNIIPKK